ncbi:MAG: hypothetical protein H6721_29155 [Sandaracinus sp.]|nr:hypothetical protein [Sandaracinus sp.]MCB9624619.1 hypothetical protein [Sandaracinus sp.]MCB9636199.1 hypothetical protein [Sandaracinus sp.]
MTAVRELHEWLTGRRPMIAVVGDPFAEAWSASDDLDGMIELVLLGGRLGLFEIDATRTWGMPPERWLFRLRTPEGRYVRVDVQRSEGPDGLRAILPTLPPLAAWREATEATEAARDPLAQYLLDVSHRGRPSPAWSARWGEGDAGLRAAWAVSHDSVAMRGVLQATGRSEAAARAQAAVRTVPSPPRQTSFASPDWSAIRRYEAALVEAVRRAVPAPFG